MDIYKKRSVWRLVLIIVGVIILAITLVYSNYLANQLEESERKNSVLYADSAQELMTLDDLDADLEREYAILRSFPLPNILQYDDGTLEGMNWGEEKNEDIAFLEERIENYKAEGGTLIEEGGMKVFVFNSPTLKYIRYFPLVQFFLVSLFILFGYANFNTSRKAEQNRVWTGMAKETAHQLGTPISAIMAWIEHLKLTAEGNVEQLDIIDELSNDVKRLDLVADRFSKIGSVPSLEETDMVEEMEKCMAYMKKRSPRKVQFSVDAPAGQPVISKINQHLFDWVVENLLRNALDAMDGKGSIRAELNIVDKILHIDITDTGKGIPPSNLKTVFKPGFSTKKRGWGLGLSLAKRIIEEYHKGKIFVKSSKLNEGTTFTIRLPIA